ncbi:MAG: transporter substrate-binding domain-containing protein [Alphaproteobacteria bacterium]|nr:transporter substrate-binding domain-containing protein [Alphaproteobacteria bacterium]
MKTMRRSVLGALAFGVLSASLGWSPAAEAQQQQQQSVLSEVLKRGVLRIATIGGNPPYSSLDPSGKPVGYDIDIANLLAEQLKLKPEFIVVDVPGRITALQTRRADVTFANFTANVERSKVIAFTDPYVVVGSIYMVKKDSPIQTVEQLNDPKYKIGFARGGTAEGISALTAPKSQKVRFDTVGDAYLAMQSGQVDSQLQDSLQNASYMAKDGDKYRNLPGNWSYEEISIGLPAGDFDWWRVLNIFVKNFNASGENARLFKKWFGYEMPAVQQKY